MEISERLQKVEIECRSFEEAFYSSKEGDFLYCDPPYFSTFSGYSASGFHEKEHKRLKELAFEAKKSGKKVIISNSDTEFIRNLYKEASQILEIEAPRAINRTSCTELLIAV
jgi:DNA adenine methylase